MDEEDVHLCLKCKSHISGLENYIAHRKQGCLPHVEAAEKDGDVKDETTRKTAEEDPDLDGNAPLKMDKITPSEKQVVDSDKKIQRPKRKRKSVKYHDEEESNEILIKKAPPVKKREKRIKSSSKPSQRKKVRRKKLQVEEVGGDEAISDTNEIEDNNNDVSNGDSDRDYSPALSNFKKARVSLKPLKPTLLDRRPKPSKKAEKADVVYECALCGYQSKSGKQLEVHNNSWRHVERQAEMDNLPKTWECFECKELFHTEKGMKGHMREHYTVFTCFQCKASYAKKSELQKHLAETNHIMKHICQFCNEEFPSFSSLKGHMSVHADEKPFKCGLCDFQTKRRADLRMHMKRHMGLKPFHCSECDFKCLKKSVLNRHMETHKERQRDWICEECGAAYCSKMVLQHHKFTQHQNGRRYPCDYEGCTYVFCYKSELIAHQRSHTKEKPYLCSRCGYEGSNTYALTKHMRIHTNEKPFKCTHPGCNYASRFSAHLVRHKRLHTGEKPYKCPFCSYRCNAQENLRKHVKNTKKHAGRDMYICKDCPEYFTTNDYKELVNHTRIKHSKDYVKLQDVSKQCGIFVPGYVSPPPDIVEQALSESQGMATGDLKIVEGSSPKFDSKSAKRREKTKKENPENHQPVANDLVQAPNNIPLIVDPRNEPNRYLYQVPLDVVNSYGVHQTIQNPNDNATVVQGVAEAMRCMVQGQSFEESRQQVTYVLTSAVPVKNQEQKNGGQVLGQIPGMVAIQTAVGDPNLRPIQLVTSLPTTQQAFISAAQAQPVSADSLQLPANEKKSLHTMQVSEATYSIPAVVPESSASTLSTESSNHVEKLPLGKEVMDKQQQLRFSQDLVEAVNQARASSGDTAAVVLLQNMAQNADAILQQKSSD